MRIRRGADRGEIRDDAFARRLEATGADPAVRTILEIGSATGAGSTAALVRGLRRGRARLFCLEALPERFAELSRRYAGEDRVTCINASSVGLDGVASEAEVRGFHGALTTALSRYPLKEVLRWRAADVELLESGVVPTDGIQRARTAAGVETFDAVLIDGSEFTGRAELDLVYEAELLLLDDVNSLKNHFNVQRLLADPAYELVESDPRLRNGYAVFQRVPAAASQVDATPRRA